jgi:heme oxygenase (biliverdin-producing, ferredoxin)
VFATQLREATREAHDAAESAPFIQQLMGGSLQTRHYVDLLLALEPVYGAMEEEFRAHGEESSVALFDHRKLDRHARIVHDLAGFGQIPGSRPLPTAVDDYVAAVHEAAASPQRLLAHHYTRYLGDLAGGQAIAARLRQHYDLDPEVLTFYDFSDLGDLVHYRRRYRDLLDLVPWSAAERADFVAESQRVFALNAALFHALGERQEPDSGESFFASERAHRPR